MRFFAIAALLFAAAASVIASPVVERTNGASLVDVLNNLHYTVTPSVQGLQAAVDANSVNVDTVKPHTDAICAAIKAAIEDSKGIKAGSCSLDEIFDLICAILNDVLGVLALVLVLADGLVLALLAAVVCLVGTLLQVICPLVWGLAGALASLVLILLAPLAILEQDAAFSVITGI